METTLRKSRIEILLLFILYMFILPRVYMDYDMGFWRQWALSIHQYGLGAAYNHGINYFPVSLYILWLFDLLHGDAQNIALYINSLKLFFVVFDFLPVVVLCVLAQKFFKYKVPYLYLLLNVAYIFNSMIWGQVDSVYTNLSFLAVVLGFAYPVLSVTLFLVAINTKLQAVVFLPVLLMVWWYGFRSFKSIILASCTVAAVQALILLPFILGGTASKFFFLLTHQVDLYHNLSICAFNLWYLIAPDNPYFINDQDKFLLVSYKATGLFLFSAATLWVLVPAWKHFYQLKKTRVLVSDYTYQMIFLGGGMICLYFFYFNSQMHERYANPIIILFFFFGVVSGNYRLYILASVPFVLSLDKCFPDFLPVIHFKLIFASKVIAIWYTLTVCYGTYLYFQLVRLGSGMGKSATHNSVTSSI